MPDSNGPEGDVVRLFEERFGVARATLAAFTFHERRDEIWACTAPPPPGIESARPPGLRALRRQGGDLKPTSTFLTALGPAITAASVDLDADALRRLLLGQRISSPCDLTDGHVALRFGGDVVGCGRLRAGSLQALIPTGRRRELLGALATNARR